MIRTSSSVRRHRILLALAATAAGLVVTAPGLAGTPAPAPSPFVGHGRLAYVSRGRLLLLDGATGTTTTVAPATAHPGSPSFSPDGRRLAYSLGEDRVAVAGADGSAPHVLRSDGAAARWLPDGRLLVGRRIYRFGVDGAPVRAGLAPADLAAWAPDGSRYAFVTRRVVHGSGGSFHGRERLEVASSLAGPRTLWFSAPISFTRAQGFVGDAIDGVVVLLHGGVLFWADPMQSASLAADGLPLYALHAPGASPARLGVTVGDTVSVAPGGTVAIGAGPDRYAWRTKTVRICSTATARCSSPAAPAGALTLDPAWSPDGKVLAFVAARAETSGRFTQETIARWYATRRLWLLSAGAATEVPHSSGAAAPTWSRDGRSLLFVASDALWLLPRLGAKPVQVSRALFPPGDWPSYYGQIAWKAQFAWWSGS